MRWRLALLVLLAALPVAVGPAWAEDRVLDLPTGRGENVMRVLLLAPAGPPRGAVVLLAGGEGSLDLSAEGTIRSAGANQLVRTRADYIAAGWLVALPDLPLDIWRERGNGRISAAHAADLGQLVALLHQQVRRVAVVGTSMGSLSAANAAARLQGDQAPDAVVLTSGLLAAGNGGLNVEESIPGMRQARQPVLMVHHRHDGCRLTPPDGPERLRPLLTAAPRVDVVFLSGGSGYGNPCNAQSAHGFMGIDDQVVTTITTWLAGL
jgi:pimeloyl-ACP methyl ester carboxylesterase